MKKNIKIPLPKFVLKPMGTFFKTEAASGIVLTFCAVLAMVVANSAFSKMYFDTLQIQILGLSLQHWINDGLMAIFFFLIGMEIKKEILIGELSTPKKAALPIAAALGGMIFPALIYFYFNPSGADARGWGIPMATDIAFALGLLTLFGKRVPLALKVFLLALAIVDDLGAVLVIAIFYTNEIKMHGLGLAAIGLALILVIRTVGIRSYTSYLLLGTVVWLGVLISGVHATIAGVVIGLLTPLNFSKKGTPHSSYSPLDNLVHWLHPWVSFGIMPIFALANAGIVLGGLEFSKLIAHPVHQGVVLGLLVGKPLGIFAFSALAVFLKVASLPKSIQWSHVLSAGFLGGVGFTMALFISNLALGPEQEIFSKTGIILGSLLSGIIGSVILLFVLPKKSSVS